MSKDLTPTPPIGTIVQWYRANERREEMMLPAVVIRQVGIGRVDLKVMKMGDDEHKRNVHHISDPVHEVTRFNVTSRDNGSWKYIDESKIPEDHYDYHKAELKKRNDVKTSESRGKLLSTLNKTV